MASGEVRSSPGINKEASPNKVVALLWHTTALLGDPYRKPFLESRRKPRETHEKWKPMQALYLPCLPSSALVVYV